VLPTTVIPAEVDNQRAHAQASPGFGHETVRQLLAPRAAGPFAVLDVIRSPTARRSASHAARRARPAEQQPLEESPGGAKIMAPASPSGRAKNMSSAGHGGEKFQLGFGARIGTRRVVKQVAFKERPAARPASRFHANVDNLPRSRR